jgi:hypothetical protein
VSQWRLAATRHAGQMKECWGAWLPRALFLRGGPPHTAAGNPSPARTIATPEPTVTG